MSAADMLDAADFDIPGNGRGHPRADDELNIHIATAKLERELIERAVVRAEGNRAEAARLLGIARPQLYAKMKKLGIAPSHRPKK